MPPPDIGLPLDQLPPGVSPDGLERLLGGRRAYETGPYGLRDPAFLDRMRQAGIDPEFARHPASQGPRPLEQQETGFTPRMPPAEDQPQQPVAPTVPAAGGGDFVPPAPAATPRRFAGRGGGPDFKHEPPLPEASEGGTMPWWMQMAGNVLGGSQPGLPKPLVDPKLPPGVQKPEGPPAVHPLQDFQAHEKYVAERMKATDIPDYAKPNLFIRTINALGDPQDTIQTHNVGSSDPRYWSAQRPGTPEYSEVEAAQHGRSALTAALHAFPEMTKLEEARLNVQAQREAAHKMMAERWFAANPGRNSDEFMAFAKSVGLGDQYSREMAAGILDKNKGGPQVQPGTKTPVSPPGVGPPKSTAEKMAEADKERIALNATVPDQQQVDEWFKKLPDLKTADQLVSDLASRQLYLRHPPTRARVIKELQSQGGARATDLPRHVEELLMRYADTGQLARSRDWTDVEGVPVRAYQGTGVRQKEVNSPMSGIRGEKYANFLVGPLARLFTGQGSILEPLGRDAVAEDAAKARAAALLLRAMHEHGYR